MGKFQVNPQVLLDTAKYVGGEAATIKELSAGINRELVNAERALSTPAGATLGSLQRQVDVEMGKLQHLLEEMVSRMGAAHENYVEAERKNVANMSPHRPGSGRSR
jgi:uncharacterized protein YukE